MKNELSISQTLVFLEILQILRNEKNILARKAIYECYIDKKSTNQEKRSFIEKLYGDFDEIGYLVKEFNLQEKLFPLYSDTIRRVWIVMEKDIKKEQIERKNQDPNSLEFGYYFTHLAIHAKKYRDKNNLKEPGFSDLRNL
ncbi:MAG: hypothetical protein K5777_02925 [Nitrosopumilus sp.]|nr:hypothetical protein [Nitrosopumilus sp.]